MTEQLVQDVGEDADVYQESFPPSCAISLPAISCRCRDLWPTAPAMHAVLQYQVAALQDIVIEGGMECTAVMTQVHHGRACMVEGGRNLLEAY